MIRSQWLLFLLVVLLAVGCAAPSPTVRQSAPTSVPTASPTRARPAGQPTRMPATATVAASPTVAQATATATATPRPLPTATATVAATPSNVAVAPVAPAVPGASGVLLPLSSTKYPVPQVLSPGDGIVYNVSQPVVRFAWAAAPTDLMTFGQTPGCISDATNMRRAFERYQLVIHSLDGARADIVQWELSTQFELNLTTVPAGRYSWSLSIVTLCDSYVLGQRGKTIGTSFIAPASPSSAPRTFTWTP